MKITSTKITRRKGSKRLQRTCYLSTRECDKLRRQRSKTQKCLESFETRTNRVETRIDIDQGIRLIQGHVLKSDDSRRIYNTSGTGGGAGFVKQNLLEEQFDHGLVSLFMNFKPGATSAERFCDEFRMCFVNYTGLCINYLAMLVFSLYSVSDKETISEFLAHARARVAKQGLEEEIVKRGSTFLLYNLLQMAVEFSIEIWRQKGCVSPLEYKVICLDTHTTKHDWLCFLFALFSCGDLSCDDMKDAKTCLNKILRIEYERSSLQGFQYEDICGRNLAKIMKSGILMSSVLSKFVDLKEANVLGSDGPEDSVRQTNDDNGNPMQCDDTESLDDPDDYTDVMQSDIDDEDEDTCNVDAVRVPELADSLDDPTGIDRNADDDGEIDNNVVDTIKTSNFIEYTSFTLDEKKKIRELVRDDGKMENLLDFFTGIIRLREICGEDPLKFFDLLRTMESSLIKEIQQMLYLHLRRKTANFYNISPTISLAIDYGLPLLRKQSNKVNFSRYHILEMLVKNASSRYRNVDDILSSQTLSCVWQKRRLYSIQNLAHPKAKENHSIRDFSNMHRRRNSKAKILIEYVDPRSTKTHQNLPNTSLEIISSKSCRDFSKIAEWLPTSKAELAALLKRYLCKYDWPNMCHRVNVDSVIRKSFLHLPVKYYVAWKLRKNVRDADVLETRNLNVRGNHEIVRCVQCMLKKAPVDESTGNADRSSVVYCINKTFNFLRKFVDEKVWDFRFDGSSVTFHYRDSSKLSYRGWLLYILDEKNIMMVDDLDSFMKTFHYVYDLRKYCNNMYDALVINAAGQMVEKDSTRCTKRRQTKLIPLTEASPRRLKYIMQEGRKSNPDLVALQRIDTLSKHPEYNVRQETLTSLRCFLIYIQPCQDHRSRCPCIWSLFEEHQRIKFRKLRIYFEDDLSAVNSANRQLSLSNHTLISGSLNVHKLRPYLESRSKHAAPYSSAMILNLIRYCVSGVGNWVYELHFPSGCRALIGNGRLYSYPTLYRDTQIDCSKYTVPILRRNDRTKNIKKADWILNKDVAFFEEETDNEGIDSDEMLYYKCYEKRCNPKTKKRKIQEPHSASKVHRQLPKGEMTEGNLPADSCWRRLKDESTDCNPQQISCQVRQDMVHLQCSPELLDGETESVAAVPSKDTEDDGIDEDLLCDYIDTYKVGLKGNLKLDSKKVVYIPLQSEQTSDYLNSTLISSTYVELSHQTRVVLECLVICSRKYFIAKTNPMARRVLNVRRKSCANQEYDIYLQEVLNMMKSDTCIYSAYLFLQISSIWILLSSPLFRYHFPVVCLRDYATLWNEDVYLRRYSVNYLMWQYHKSSVKGEHLVGNFFNFTYPFCECDRVPEQTHKRYVTYLFEKIYRRLMRLFVETVKQLGAFDKDDLSEENFRNQLAEICSKKRFDVELDTLIASITETVTTSENISLESKPAGELHDKVIRYPNEDVSSAEIQRRISVLEKLRNCEMTGKGS